MEIFVVAILIVAFIVMLGRDSGMLGGGLQQLQSSFEIRSGFLYDLTGDVEYRKK